MLCFERSQRQIPIGKSEFLYENCQTKADYSVLSFFYWNLSEESIRILYFDSEFRHLCGDKSELGVCQRKKQCSVWRTSNYGLLLTILLQKLRFFNMNFSLCIGEHRTVSPSELSLSHVFCFCIYNAKT